MYDLLVIGEINPDLILRGDVAPAFGQAEKLVDDATLVIGSSSVIMACGAARLGLSVGFAGLVGDDLFGRFMLDAMAERGVDSGPCIVSPHLRTGLSVILARPGGDRAILTFPGTMALMEPQHLNLALLDQARHLHVSSYFLLDGLRPALPAFFREAQRRGLTTSLDTNYDPRGRWDAAEILDHCDVLLPNEAEALALSGRATLAEAVDTLGAQVPTLAVKLGDAGGLARQSREDVIERPLAVDVVDTVGAGDSFDAGFLYGYLNGWSLRESLRLAVACGSLSATAAGGTAAQPTLDEALAALITREA